MPLKPKRSIFLFCLSLYFNAAIALLFSCVTVKAQEAYDAHGHYTKSSFYITMRDGVRLYTTAYLPRDTSRQYPIIMVRTPYGIGAYQTDQFNIRAPESMIREGYIFVNQDVRGRFMSEGKFVEVRPEEAWGKGPKATDESTDAYDTIDWLVKSIPNNNGRVGIWGISYPGFYAGAAGIHSHPALKAISPQAPVSDWFIGDDDHHNGALFLLDFVGFYNGFGVERPGNRPTTTYPAGPVLNIMDAYQFYLDLGPLKSIDVRLWYGNVEHWNEINAHPDYDAWWKSRALPEHMKGVNCAVMTVGGWFDAEDLYGPFAVFHQVAKWNPATPNTLVIGPWTHGGWGGGPFDHFGDESFGQKTGDWYRENRFIPFFRHYLKDQGDWNPPCATVFATGANQWWGFDSWPPRSTRPVSFYLGADHHLMGQAPRGSRAADFEEYVSDPANPVPYIAKTQVYRRNEYMIDDQSFATARPDVVSWQSDPLERDFIAAGTIRADLQVSTTGTDADFVVKVIDVTPDEAAQSADTPNRLQAGRQRLVRAEIMRARYRDSFSNPSALTPGRVTRVAFDLRDVCHVFRKGHRIMVQVQSSWFPLVDRNPQTFVNIYKADEKDFQKATHRIYRTSKVIVPELLASPAPLADH